MTGNTVKGNDMSGLWLEVGVTATGNTVGSNNEADLMVAGTYRDAGIRVGWGSIVKGNTLYSNTRHNIFVWGYDNAIEENLVTLSTYGIYFDGTGNFYANNRASGNTTNYGSTAGNTDGGGNASF